jgi:hypothetical protein
MNAYVWSIENVKNWTENLMTGSPTNRSLDWGLFVCDSVTWVLDWSRLLCLSPRLKNGADLDVFHADSGHQCRYLLQYPTDLSSIALEIEEHRCYLCDGAKNPIEQPQTAEEKKRW